MPGTERTPCRVLVVGGGAAGGVTAAIVAALKEAAVDVEMVSEPRLSPLQRTGSPVPELLVRADRSRSGPGLVGQWGLVAAGKGPDGAFINVNGE